MPADDNIIKRIPPHSSEAERSVVGSMIMDDTKNAILTASEILERSDFYEDRYGLLFEVIVELFNEQKPADSVMIQEKLKQKGAPAEITNPAFLAEIVDEVPTSAYIEHYAKIVRDKSILRSVIRVNNDIENECYKGELESADVLQQTEKKIFDLVQNKGRSQIVPIKDVVIEALQHIQAVAKSDSKLTGIPSGFERLDNITAGFQKSELILVAARPSMGKTAFVLNIAQHACFKKDFHCLFFSLEMSKEQLINRLLAMESRVDSANIRVGNLNDDEWHAIIDSAGVVGTSNLAIDDTAGITVTEMASKCRRYKLEHGLDMIMIDYLQLMTGSRSGRGSDVPRQQEISDISRSLKALARELKVPVIALSQLSREVEKRPDHRPQLSDLRESGAIEQDADVVMFIYRDDYYNEDSERKGIADIIIAKQRNGSIGTISLAWLPSLTKFENLAEEK